MSQGRIRFPAFPSKNPAKEAPEHKKIQSGARGRKKALSHPSRRGRRAQPLRQEQQPAVPGVRCRNLALLRATKAACKSAKTSASQSKCKAPCGFLRRVSGEVCLPPRPLSWQSAVRGGWSLRGAAWSRLMGLIFKTDLLQKAN